MTSHVGDNFATMHEDYLKAYYEYFGSVDYALHLPAFTKKLKAGKILRVASRVEFMTNATFKKWIESALPPAAVIKKTIADNNFNELTAASQKRVLAMVKKLLTTQK